jgi:hypothetical protein
MEEVEVELQLFLNPGSRQQGPAAERTLELREQEAVGPTAGRDVLKKKTAPFLE